MRHTFAKPIFAADLSPRFANERLGHPFVVMTRDDR